jgi:hypothetical protein
MRMLAFGQPRRYQRRDPSGVTICTHARCPKVRKPGPRPMSTRSCPGVHNGRHDRTAFWTPPAPSCPAGHRPLHPARHGEPEAIRTGERTNGTEGSRTSSIATTTKAARRDTPSPCGGAGGCGLANQGRLGDGNTASATPTTAATRQLLGVAPRSKPRLGALLSSDDFRLRVDRAATVHPLWQWQCRRGQEVLQGARRRRGERCWKELGWKQAAGMQLGRRRSWSSIRR